MNSRTLYVSVHVISILFALNTLQTQTASHPHEHTRMALHQPSRESNYATADYAKKFQNTLLVVHFNAAYYQNIEFLKQLYGPFFSHIVFYGPSTGHPEVTGMWTHEGFLLCGVLRDALEKNPGYDGYLILQDDCILNIWNCAALDLTKIWFPASSSQLDTVNTIPAFSIANLKTGMNASYWWWSSNWGFRAMQQTFTQLLPSDITTLTHNLGPNCAAGTLCDMFYIPGRLRNDIMRLTHSFQQIFVEIAVPTMLCCLDVRENWQPVSMFTAFGSAQDVLKEQWPTAFTCVHPCKLSSSENRNRVLSILSTQITR